MKKPFIISLLFTILLLILFVIFMYKYKLEHYNTKTKIAILVISSESTERWKEEKKIWLKSIKNNKLTNIDIFFLETDNTIENNTFIIKNNTIYCGIEDNYIPGIIHKTLLGLKALPNYDFYIRTNLSTVIDYKELNNYLQNIPTDIFFSTGVTNNTYFSAVNLEQKQEVISKINEKSLPYYGDSNTVDSNWFSGWALIFSEKYAKLLVTYFENIPFILESNIADDVLLSILIGKHDDNINDKVDNEYISDIVFYRIKKILSRIFTINNTKKNGKIFYRCKNKSKNDQDYINDIVNT